MSDARSSRTALITGTAGGIGTALCTAFKNAGYRVVGTDIREDASSCDAFIPLDLRTLSASDAARQAGLERLREAITGNELNVLVNNAAIQILGVTERVTIDDWRVTLDTNLLAPFLLTQGLLSELERGRGSVVNIASVHANVTKPGFVAYATSKAALVGMTRSFAVDLGGRIRVNAILPSATTTPMLIAGFESNAAALEQLGAVHPLGRIARPEEVAAAAVYLASEAASFVTGAVLAVDGGVGSRLHDPL